MQVFPPEIGLFLPANGGTGAAVAMNLRLRKLLVGGTSWSEFSYHCPVRLISWRNFEIMEDIPNGVPLGIRLHLYWFKSRKNPAFWVFQKFWHAIRPDMYPGF
jgi:hypothetical protein